jgi:hypothetical protein
VVEVVEGAVVVVVLGAVGAVVGAADGRVVVVVTGADLDPSVPLAASVVVVVIARSRSIAANRSSSVCAINA